MTRTPPVGSASEGSGAASALRATLQMKVVVGMGAVSGVTNAGVALVSDAPTQPSCSVFIRTGNRTTQGGAGVQRVLGGV